jgi:hypothetical protein
MSLVGSYFGENEGKYRGTQGTRYCDRCPCNPLYTLYYRFIAFIHHFD